MKKLFAIVLLCLLSVATFASEVRLTWNPSVTPGVTNYVILGSTNTIPDSASTTNMLIAANTGTNLSVSISSLTTGMWFFRALAEKAGVRSDLSNEVQVEVPALPTGLHTVTIEYLPTLSATNWAAVGAFRLKIN